VRNGDTLHQLSSGEPQTNIAFSFLPNFFQFDLMAHKDIGHKSL